MPLRIKRATPKLVPTPQLWINGRNFSAVSPSGATYFFRLVNADEGIAIEVNSGRTWWVDADRHSIRLSTASSVVAEIVER